VAQAQICEKKHPLKGLKWGFSGENSSSKNCKLTIPIWLGHSGDAHIKLSRSFAITSAEALSPVIYNCRTNGLHFGKALTISTTVVNEEEKRDDA
jgi:hypothetical protein